MRNGPVILKSQPRHEAVTARPPELGSELHQRVARQQRIPARRRAMLAPERLRAPVHARRQELLRDPLPARGLEDRAVRV